MEAKTRYVVYELNMIMGNEKFMALEKVNFKGWQHNNFDSEQDAIDALIKDEKTYNEYIILKSIYIQN